MKLEIGNGYALRDWVSAWNHGNQGRWIALADDYDIWSNLDDSFPHPYTRKDAEEWVALQSSKDPAEHFAICDAAGSIGGIGVNTERDDSTNLAELGYFVGKPFWGRGIATAAAKAVTAYGFDTVGLIRIFAKVNISNGASARVLEKVDYRREELVRGAKLRQREPVDYLTFAMLREDWSGPNYLCKQQSSIPQCGAGWPDTST